MKRVDSYIPARHYFYIERDLCRSALVLHKNALRTMTTFCGSFSISLYFFFFLFFAVTFGFSQCMFSRTGVLGLLMPPGHWYGQLLCTNFPCYSWNTYERLQAWRMELFNDWKDSKAKPLHFGSAGQDGNKQDQRTIRAIHPSSFLPCHTQVTRHFDPTVKIVRDDWWQSSGYGRCGYVGPANSGRLSRETPTVEALKTTSYPAISSQTSSWEFLHAAS